MEALRLRVKDIDFSRNELLIRDGKGQKDRVTVLSVSVIDPLRRYLARVRVIHQQVLADGGAGVHLPDPLARKYPKAPWEWAWQ